MNPKLEASLIMIPSAYKEDKVYSIIPQDRSGDFTFTRASDGTRVNSEGYIERVPWNLLQQSNTFNTTWANIGTTETGGQPDKDGGNNAWKIDKTAAGGRIQQANTTIGVQTISVYAKAGTLNWLHLGSNTGGGYFNLANGTTGSILGTATISSQIESVGNGWYRCSVIFDTTALLNIRIYPADADNDTSGTSGNIYIQDAQLVSGSTAKPYFPTTDRLNVPRLDYSGGCPSLLLEPQRTNLLQYSEQFDESSYWSPIQSTITANDTIAPDGQTTADKMLASATTGNHQIDGAFFSIVSGAVTSSIYAKKGNIDFVRLRHNSTTQQIRAWFDLENGVVGSVDAGGSATIEDAGNGWYRCTMTESGNTKTGLASLQIFMNESDGQTTWTADGDEYIYLWGAQVEQGSYATSYIPTRSASVTRVADEVNTLQTTSLLNQTNNNTVFGEFVNNRVEAGVARFFALYDSALSNNDRILLYSSHVGTTFNITLQYKVGGATTEISLGNQTYGTPFKVACVFDSTTVSFFINGSKVGSKTVTNADNFYYAKLTDVLNDLGIETSQLIFFPTALTDAECIALTTL